MSEQPALCRPALGPSGHVVAVVDDDSRVLESLENLLQSSGYRVCVYLTAEQYLHAPAQIMVDCLISDICLPGISGIGLLRALRAEGRCPPAILSTAHRREQFEQDARDLGVVRLFIKPLDTAELLAALRSLLP